MKITVPQSWRNLDFEQKVKNYTQDRDGTQIRKGNNGAYLPQLGHAINHLAGNSGRVLQSFSNGHQMNNPTWENSAHDALFRSQFNDTWRNGPKHRVHAIMAFKGASEKHFYGGGDGRQVLSNPCDFSSWTKTVAGDSVSANTTIGPNGVQEADSFICDATDTFHGLTQAYATAADTYCFSVFATYIAAATKYLYMDVSSLSNVSGYFKLTDLSYGTMGSAVTDYGMIPYVTKQKVGFYRFFIEFTSTAASHTFRIGPAPDDGDNTFAGDGVTTYGIFWGATLTRGGLQEYPRAKVSPFFQGYNTDTVKRHYITFNVGWGEDVTDAIKEEAISVSNSSATDGYFIEDMYTAEEPLSVLDTDVHAYAPTKGLTSQNVLAEHFEDIRAAQHEVREDAMVKVFSWSALGAGDNMPASQASDQGGIYITSGSAVNVFDLSVSSRTAASLGFFYDAYKCGRGIATEVKLIIAAIAKVDSGSAVITFHGPAGTTQTSDSLTVTATSYTAYGGASSDYVMLRTDIEWDDVTTARNKVDITANVTTANNLSIISLDAWLILS